MSSRLPGFYRLSPQERRQRLAHVLGDRAATVLAGIDAGAFDLAAADRMTENVVGVYGLPFAIAANMVVDGRDVLVPMVIEEPSVVAAASNAARMVRAHGGFVTEASAPIMIGQIQVTGVSDTEAGSRAISAAEESLLTFARQVVPRLLERGGGPTGISVRRLAASGPDGGVLVVHLLVDCRDAMGANLVNTLCEALAPRVAELAGGRPGLRILSNLCDQRTVTARCITDDAALGGSGVGAAIAAASRFAELDPYRAATHNKGIMNGVDAVLLATGQDWRAVSAGAHAWAARDGHYRPLAVWREVGPGRLEGVLTMPMAVGTVGGALHAHPGAMAGLTVLGLDRVATNGGAEQLARIVAAVGLASNLAALRALAVEGIQRGHMGLHARMVARAAGVEGSLVDRVADLMVAGGEVSSAAATDFAQRLGQA